MGKNKILSKQKNLTMDAAVCDQFEKFCEDRGLVEAKAAAAAFRLFMVLQPDTRERVLLDNIDPTLVQIGPKPKPLKAKTKQG